MERTGERRFPSSILKQVKPLKDNLYINPADPMYYEKVLRYQDAHSCEAHYYVGQKYLKQGNDEKALYHLQKSAEGESPYAQMAKAAVANMTASTSPPLLPAESPEAPRRNHNFLPHVIVLGFLLILICLLLITLQPGIRAVVSRYVAEPVGMHVVYEAGERPFYVYFNPAQTTRAIEKALYDEALKLGKQYPKDRIVLYGLYGIETEGEIVRAYPATSAGLIGHAFVTAHYHAESDSYVHIRFVHPDMAEESGRHAQVQTATNLIRTALVQYREEHGAYPHSLHELTADYPDNYLSFLPSVPGRSLHGQHEQPGEWLFDPSAEHPEDILQPVGYSPVPYVPMEVIITKQDHRLMLVNGQYLMHQSTVGLGKNNRTPEGEFVIDQRVRHPQGIEPDVYGTAALGFGDYAIHGTNEPASIGNNASQGCVRLLNEQMEELYPYVPRGAHIRIQEEQPVSAYILAGAAFLPTTSSMSDADETADGVRFAWLH